MPSNNLGEWYDYTVKQGGAAIVAYSLQNPVECDIYVR